MLRHRRCVCGPLTSYKTTETRAFGQQRSKHTVALPDPRRHPRHGMSNRICHIRARIQTWRPQANIRQKPVYFKADLEQSEKALHTEP